MYRPRVTGENEGKKEILIFLGIFEIKYVKYIKLQNIFFYKIEPSSTQKEELSDYF